jgi:hypothetical protein
MACLLLLQVGRSRKGKKYAHRVAWVS